jgi:putative ABC transport system substrate-binding protein
MKRREFITLLGGTALAWPVTARAQQSAKPLIALVHAATAAANAQHVTALSQGLKDTGYTVGENAMVEYHWAEGKYDRLPAVMGDLVRRRVAVIVAGGGIDPAAAAKAATKTIPIVFLSGVDPVRVGLVASLNRAGGNVTGVSFFNTALTAKRLELAHELLPAATVIAYIVNPNNSDVEQHTKDMQAAARKLGLDLHVLNATTAREIDDSFERIAALRAQALMVAADPFLGSQRAHSTALAARLAIPVIGDTREYISLGGIMTYGTSLVDAYVQAGVYVGRILKGEKPADLPVTQPTKFELSINLKAAKALGITVPPTLLARADEVIE